jgi:outer membrane receptor protein involved in Fe transport
MNPSRARFAGCILALLLAIPGLAAAQNAQINGSVRDQTGAIVPGATVTARNQETGLTRSDVSDDKGDFRLPALPPGIYKVTVELAGFNTETRPDILLTIEQTASLAFTLKPATVAETLTVTGESPIVDTNRSDIATSVSPQQIQDLPVASRRWIDLVMLVPGTSQDNIRGFFYRGNANIGGGTREYSNMSVVDGVNNTWAEMGEPRQNFAMDSIREFKVSTSNYKAEYGLATGGVMTVVSKSGTNSLHGSGLLFFRDKVLTAKEYFQTTKPDYRRYQYGGTVGGPIVRDKAHFFFAVEATDETQFFTVFANGLWPTVPLGDTTIQGEGTYPSEQNRWTYTAKVDYQLKQNQSVFMRFAQENEYRPIITSGGRTHPTASFDFAVPRQSIVGAHTWIINDRMLNDARFQYAYSKYEVSAPYSHGSLDPGDFGTARTGLCSVQYSFPSIIVGGCGNSQMGPEHRWEFKDDFSFLKANWGGTHQWKLGFDYSYIPFDADNLGVPLGSYTFPKDTPYNPSDQTTWPTQYTETRPRYANVPTKHLAFYLQDDWELGRGMTFNLGLRYDRQIGSFNEDLPHLQELAGEVIPGAGYPPGTDWYNTFYKDSQKRGDRNNFGPRVGFAWDPTSTGSLNIHAAYGIFYDNIRTLMNFDEIWWAQTQQIVISSPTFGNPYGGKPREAYLLTPNIWVMDSGFRNAYAQQVNGGFTYLLMRNMAVSADALFTFRYDDLGDPRPDINLPDQNTRVKPYPQFARIQMLESSQDNEYKALLVKLEKRLSRNYQYMVSYTLSQADDSVIRNSQGDYYGFQRVDSPSTADRRHRLVVSGIVQLPYQMQVSAIADFRSQLPFNPGSSLDINRDGYTGDNPPGVAFRSGCRNLDIDAINTFRASRSLAAVSEADIACPAFANVDLRYSKFFNFGRAGRVELIAQLFNVFNRANFATPSSNPGAATFGKVNAIQANINAPSRQAEFAIRVQF